MVDDPIGGLDDVGMAEFVKNLRLLGNSKECSMVLCTLPSDRILDGVDQTIQVVKQYGESKVKKRT
jgi:ABC-type transporter Mla maintaining outer membrane lipid asymmetry ATPase subunit MlaF